MNDPRLNEEERRLRIRNAAGAGAAPGSLTKACLWIAAGEDADIDVEEQLARVRALAERVRTAYEGGASPPWRALAQVLGDELGFRGSAQDYDAPENSYMHRVLDRQRGLPILLSVLWVDVARFAGMHADGIGLPGHFVAAVGQGDQRSLVDPFGGGRPLSQAEALGKAAAAVGVPRSHADTAWVRPTEPQRIVVRVLSNLAGSYERRDDVRRVARVLGDLLAVEPLNGPALARRGLALSSLGEGAAALADLQASLDLLPPGVLHGTAYDAASRLAKRRQSTN